MARRTKPPVAEWIARERKRLGLSVDQLVERLSLVGVHVGRQTVQVWESYADRRPKADTLDALERIFGSAAPDRAQATESGDSIAALVGALQAAITAQTEAIVAAIQARDSTLESLLGELGKYRRSQLDVLRALQETVPPAVPMPEDEPEHEPHGGSATRAGRA